MTFDGVHLLVPHSHTEGARFVIQRSDVTRFCSATRLMDKLKPLE